MGCFGSRENPGDNNGAAPGHQGNPPHKNDKNNEGNHDDKNHNNPRLSDPTRGLP